MRKSAIGKEPLERGLPHVVMRVDEARRYELVGAVDHIGVTRRLDFWFDFGDAIAFDEDVCSASGDFVVLAVEEDGASAEQEITHRDSQRGVR